MPVGRTHVISVHWLRRTARARERIITEQLARRSKAVPGTFVVLGLPIWAHGVRVEKAGRFQWAVVATEAPGH
jgi:hypothetical protein